MGLFKKRESITQNISYLALMAAINVIFVLLTALFQPLMFVMIFILPLTSAVVTLFCKKQYFPIYFVVTVALCLLITSWASIFDTFFYVIPSMISGFAFGLMIEKKISAIFIISISTVIQYLITFLTFLILDLILPELNFIDVLLRMFGLADFVFKDYFIHVFLYLLSIIQTVLTYIVIKSEILKLGFEINLDIKRKWIASAANLFFAILSLIMMFIYGPLVYIFLFISLNFAIYSLIEIFMCKNKLFVILGVVTIFIGLIFYIAFNRQIEKPKQIILIGTSNVMISILYFANYLFVKKTNSTKIE